MGDTGDDPTGEFLDFIRRDIGGGNVVPLPSDLLDRSAALVAGMTVDLDEELPSDD